MGRVLVGSALLAVVVATGVAATEKSAPAYGDGYRYGREGAPAHHLSEDSSPDEAEAECGEHANSDGTEVSDEWFRGCADGARGLPEAE